MPNPAKIPKKDLKSAKRNFYLTFFKNSSEPNFFLFYLKAKNEEKLENIFLKLFFRSETFFVIFERKKQINNL